MGAGSYHTTRAATCLWTHKSEHPNQNRSVQTLIDNTNHTGSKDEFMVGPPPLRRRELSSPQDLLCEA